MFFLWADRQTDGHEACPSVWDAGPAEELCVSLRCRAVGILEMLCSEGIPSRVIHQQGWALGAGRSPGQAGRQTKPPRL